MKMMRRWWWGGDEVEMKMMMRWWRWWGGDDDDDEEVMKMMTQCHGSLVKERHLETVNGNCSVSVSCHTLGKWNLILNITCHLFFSPQNQTNESRLSGWCWLTQWWRVQTLDSSRLSGGCERLLSESPAIILTLATRCYTSVRGKPTEKYFWSQPRNTLGYNWEIHLETTLTMTKDYVTPYWHIIGTLVTF